MKSPCSAGPRRARRGGPGGGAALGGSLTPEAGWVYVFYADWEVRNGWGGTGVYAFWRRGMTARGERKLPLSPFTGGKTPVFLAFSGPGGYNCLQCVQQLAAKIG